MRWLVTLFFLFGFWLTLDGVMAQVEQSESTTTESAQGQLNAQQFDQATPQPTPTPVPPAVQPVNLTLSPISLNLVTDPGTTTSGSIKIRNNGTDPEYLQLRLATFVANVAGDAPIIQDFAETDEAQDWFQFAEDNFRVGPGEWKTIPITFSPPQSAALGYYYAILVERQREVEIEEGQSLISGVPAILVLTEVNSPLAKRQLELVSFTVSKRLYEYLPIEFAVTIKNTGNVQAMPLGDIFIDGQRTKDLAAMPLNPTKGLILPGSQRTFLVQWDDGFPKYVTTTDEAGNETIKLDWDFSKVDRFKIGKFNATSLFIYDDGSKDIPTQATVSFWVVPWKLMIIAGLLIALVMVGIILPTYLLIRHLKKKKLKR